MESSPFKRRKLSPTTSIIAVDASDYQSQSIHDNDVQPRTPRQASFLSPTKASLARYNPSLLPRPKSAGEGVQLPESASKVVHRQHGEKTSRPSNGLNPVALRSTTPTSSPSKVAGRLRASTASPHRDSISSARKTSNAPKPRSRKLGRASSPAKVLPISSAPIILASPPRPAQELDGEAEDTVSQQLDFNLQASAAHPQNDLASRPQDRIQREKDHGEPKLPLTPTQLGLEVAPEPPKGLLYSSPSRRSGRRNGSSTKSSPLKPLDPPLKTYSHELLGKEPATTEDATEVRPRAVGAQEDFETITKKKILDQLLLQYQELKNDVAELEREARQADFGGHEHTDNLISMITSSNPSRQCVPMHEKLVSISFRVAQFMPFSKPLASRKQPDSISSLPLPSHYPLQLEDPLPHLRVFTPLTINSVSSLVPSSDRSQPWLQHHNIALTSPGNLLRVEMYLSVNAADQSVNSLALQSLSSWAKSELDAWLNDQVAAGDLPMIGWACGRYWEVAHLRARCWRSCYQQFRGLIPAAIALQTSTFSVGVDTVDSKQEVSLADGAEIDVNDFEDMEDLNSDLGTSDSGVRSKLGQQSILFSAFGVSFLVTWRISFNWTGEIESHISACASFPKAWQNADERASLGNIGEVFDRLLHDRGVFAAVRIIVALLYKQD
ncbi:hypothetical protein MMC17_009281 [Xylographa soralifera]|nr:hypothetical protein [Xylographa soralifera]